MTDAIAVFSDLTLEGPADGRSPLRQALIAAAEAPWVFDRRRSEEVMRNTISGDDVLVFVRKPADDLPGASLTLNATDRGYYVPNVVPVTTGELTRDQYNAILRDFADRIVSPVATRHAYSVNLTAAHQGLGDWVSSAVAQALRTFSAAANKSTGANHPLDQRRWFAFILAAHRGHSDMDPERLARWLHEVDGWDQNSAHHLAGDYERSIALLSYADMH